MSEIKRYDIDWSALYRYDRYPVEDPEGEWVRWEDVEKVIEQMQERMEEAFNYKVQQLSDRLEMAESRANELDQ